MIIKEVFARKIKDSRGEPTIEVFVNNSKSSSPSGKSTGKYETPPYFNSLNWNINFINKQKFSLQINNFSDLLKIESFIKKKTGLKDIKQFGANALFALESAALKALAKSQKKELWEVINPKSKKIPIPLGNVIGGGLHSNNKNHPTFQEFLIIPRLNSAEKNIILMMNIHKKIKNIINSNSENDEGAWNTDLNEDQILKILSRFKDIDIGVDVAASSFFDAKILDKPRTSVRGESWTSKNPDKLRTSVRSKTQGFFDKGKYKYNNKALDPKAQINYINSLIEEYNILYIEDPLQEEDFNGFSRIIKKNLVSGDDLTATQILRLKRAIKNNSINAMIIKPNQNGSLLELKEIFGICRKNKIKTILSHRSGETLDDSLADYAVGFEADFIKCGIATKWRKVKLKRLIHIEKSIAK
mgnify:CR=1 FL=1